MKVFGNYFNQKSSLQNFSGGSIPLISLYSLEYTEKHKKTSILLSTNNETIKTLALDAQTLNKNFFQSTYKIYELYTWHKCPYSSPIYPPPSFLKQRLKTLIDISTETNPYIIFSNVEALSLLTLSTEILKKFSFSLKTNDIFSPAQILQKLKFLGYEQQALVLDSGTFSLRGDILDVYPVHLEKPIRIDFFDNSIEKIRFFNPETQLTEIEKKINEPVFIYQAKEALINEETLPYFKSSLKNFFDKNGLPKKLRDELFENISHGGYPEQSPFWLSFIYEDLKSTYSFLPDNSHSIFYENSYILEHFSSQKKYELSSDFILPPPESMYKNILNELTLNKNFTVWEPLLNEKKTDNSIKTTPVGTSTTTLLEEIKILLKDQIHFYIFCETQSEMEKIIFLLNSINLSKNFYTVFISPLSESFYLKDQEIVFLTTESFFKKKKYQSRSHEKKSGQEEALSLLSLDALKTGDIIVHFVHGMGVYQGLKRLSLAGAPSDYLCIEYLGGDKLYLPVDRMNLIQKHSNNDTGIKLHKLGTSAFENTKNKVKSAVKEIAFNLLELYAKRASTPGPKIELDLPAFSEFESFFPYQETIDQNKSIDDIIKDFQSGIVMDRVICGDVGFGKTEVAMRAAFLAVHSGYQVAVLVPTTILCLQHEKNFKDRFHGTGVQVQSISRFKTKKEQMIILDQVQSGQIDILIGTHRILSKDIKFKNLGLLVIDEEHRFGVEHKEKLKNIKVNTHALTLTATPIPRTLQMSLSGIRDLSIIQTPPKERLPIQTFISRFNKSTIKEAVQYELSRNGQIIFLHNKVKSIYTLAETLQELLPHVKIDVAHGQLPEKTLENKILSFFNKKTDLLLCTTIIESGIDIPSANTLIVNRADTLGLSQLYQIRGRVGRGDKRAYAYLLVPELGRLSEEAQRRLDVIQKFVDLGSGFKIATQDLEMRGGGDVLGAEQSGHMNSVGIELYMEMLKEAVDELKGNEPTPSYRRTDPEIKVPYSCFMDEKYISDIQIRLKTYKRLSLCNDEQEVNQIEYELQDRFGALPEEALNLLWIIRIKILLRSFEISSLLCSQTWLSFTPNQNNPLFTPDRTIRALEAYPEKYQISPDSRFNVNAPNESVKKIYEDLSHHLNFIKQI